MKKRPRRNRRSAAIRALLAEHRLGEEDFILPLFMTEVAQGREKIDSLPVAYRHSKESLFEIVDEAISYGIRAFVLFPVIPEKKKNKRATFASNPENFYLRYTAKLKEKYGDEIVLFSDVAMDPYSSDGHDGLVQDGVILNDETLPILTEMAIAQAKAGFDYIAPSDMMDGRIAAIREGLDETGFSDTGILSYTAKYASAFYGPFRDALDSTPKSGDKKSYQMDPANNRGALLEARLDEREGADMLMVKPALHYLDIIARIKEQTKIPLACYHVSGECASLIAACQKGWLEYESAMPEALLSMKRAGADLILTYFALDYAKLLRGEELSL